VAEKFAVVAPAATVTAAGTVRAVLLLDRLTVVPPLGAAGLIVTVHESVPGATNALLVQVSELGTEGTTAAPVPLKLTTAVPLVALLVMVI
jgi:hypothetical protein